MESVSTSISETMTFPHVFSGTAVLSSTPITHLSGLMDFSPGVTTIGVTIESEDNKMRDGSYQVFSGSNNLGYRVDTTLSALDAEETNKLRFLLQNAAVGYVLAPIPFISAAYTTSLHSGKQGITEKYFDILPGTRLYNSVRVGGYLVGTSEGGTKLLYTKILSVYDGSSYKRLRVAWGNRFDSTGYFYWLERMKLTSNNLQNNNVAQSSLSITMESN